MKHTLIIRRPNRLIQTHRRTDVFLLEQVKAEIASGRKQMHARQPTTTDGVANLDSPHFDLRVRWLLYICCVPYCDAQTAVIQQ